MDMNRKLPPDLAAAVGEYIVTWTSAQNLVLFAVAELMVGKHLDEDDDLTVTAPLFGMGARTHLGLLRALATARLPAEVATKVEKLNCPVCHGSGKGASCGACGGSGSTAVWEADPISMQNRMVTKPCMRCQMSGRVACVFCGGAGKIHSGA